MTGSPALAAFLTGLLLSGSLIVAIGAQNTFVLQQGLRRAHVGAVVATCAALDLALMALGVSGLAVSLGRHPQLLSALALGGAALLAAYGLAALRRALHPASAGTAAGVGGLTLAATVVRVLSISLLNPHVYLDTVVLVGAVGARQPAGTQGLFLAGAGLASCCWFAALGYGARVLAPLFARPMAWRILDGAVCVTMFVLAARLAMDAWP